MFFSGDPSARKRVALGRRSKKQRERQKLLEQKHLERERRSWIRKQTSAAIKIQELLSAETLQRKKRCACCLFEGARGVLSEFYQLYEPRCENPFFFNDDGVWASLRAPRLNPSSVYNTHKPHTPSKTAYQSKGRHSFGPGSTFHRHLLFFFDAHNAGDLSTLVEVSQFVRQCPQGCLRSLNDIV